MISEKNRILTEKQVRQMIKRMAYQVYENSFHEKEINLVGVFDKGYHLAELILHELKGIAEKKKLRLIRLDINKEKPLAEEVRLDVPEKEIKGRKIVLIDDVLNSGRTVAHSQSKLLEYDVRGIETLVLVNRSHKQFPISANYSGYELSTTIDNHVEVRLDKDFGVYLF